LTHQLRVCLDPQKLNPEQMQIKMNENFVKSKVVELRLGTHNHIPICAYQYSIFISLHSWLVKTNQAQFIGFEIVRTIFQHQKPQECFSTF